MDEGALIETNTLVRFGVNSLHVDFIGLIMSLVMLSPELSGF